MPTQTSEKILVDLTHITPVFEQFFYKVLQIPPEVPVVQAPKVQYYVDIFLNQTIGLALDDPDKFIININRNELLTNVISEDLQVITENLPELKLILLHALNHVLLSINHKTTHIYMISLVNPSYMIVTAYKLNEEADLLVYS